MKNFKSSPKQWIKFAVATVFYIAFAIWLGNLWILLGLPLIFDIYLTKVIPWTWWKKIKNAKIRKVFEWVDAIVFALVAVYFINLYLFQNYKIPTGSLEKTLLIGDHLFVSKLAYGPRTPNTPFSFPLVQHTFPIINTKSYLEKPQWESRRLKGFGKVERNDIVVFNFPAGDTVVTARQAEDYESVCYDVGMQQLQMKGIKPSDLKAQGIDARVLCLSIGRNIIVQDKATYGDILYRPVDRRENYVKRCVGLPGDSLQIINRELYINGKKQVRPEGVQHYCKVIASQQISEEVFENLEISQENYKQSFVGNDAQGNYVYILPMTLQKQHQLKALTYILEVQEQNISDLTQSEQTTYPAGYNTTWTVDNYGPIWIPKARVTIPLTLQNLALYERAIRNYEGNTLEVKNAKIYINGAIATSYTFAMDYYWMMGDNRHNSADSRIWGFVPEDHVVGQPLFVWLSLNSEKGWLSGKIRLNRFFKNARK
ncbi:MAG: S26 family signal peptidase [Paludibacteraceae bacterium]|nr:S26 family signal peptidase [Paludibacteraceae bacterium]MBN2786749.1 S26 family signal peptidase [Paludibacteraceae bacterium]